MHLSYTCVSPYSRRLTRHRHLLHADFRNTNEEQQRTNTEAESSLLRRLSPLVEKLKREVPGLFQNFQTGLRKEQRYMLCVQGISNDVKNTQETLLHQMGVGTMVTHARKIQLPAWVHAFHGLRGSASITEGLAARWTEQSRPRRSPSPPDPPELTQPGREQTCRLPPAASHVGTVSTKAALAPAARERAQRRAVSVKLRPRRRQSAAGGPGPGRRPRCTAACTRSSPAKPTHRLPTLRPWQADSFIICLFTLGLPLLHGGIEEAAQA